MNLPMDRTADVLARAFGLDTVKATATHIEHSITCSMCGNVFSETGYHKRALIKSMTGEVSEIFNAACDYVCPPCAACFEDSRMLTSNLFATVRGYGCKPMVASASATDERPAWRDLVRRIERGEQCVAIVTSNTKRRLWYRAPVSAFGSAWRVLFVDGDTDRVLKIDATLLLDVLNCVEEIYTRGYNKHAIMHSLFSGLPAQKLNAELLPQLLRDDARLSVYRDSDELLLATFIAQKEGIE